jgi:small-conductance mechanosensitive channel
MRLLHLLLLLGALLAGLPAAAQTAGGEAEAPAERLERWDAEAAEIQKRIEAGGFDPAAIDAMRATLEAQRAAIPELVAAVKAELAPLQQQLEALGPAPEDPRQEAPEVTLERERLGTRIADIEARLKLLSQADARAAAIAAQLSDLRRQLFTRELLTRGPSPLEPGVAARAFASLVSLAADIAGETATHIAESRLDMPTVLRAGLALALLGAALFLVLRARRALLTRLVRPLTPEAPGKRRVLAGLGATVVRLLVPALALALFLAAVWSSGFLGPQGQTLVRGLAWTALVVIGAYGLGGAFYAPHAPALRFSRLSEAEAIAAHRWLMALAAVVGLDRVLVIQGDALGLAIEALSLVNAVLLVLGGIAVWGYLNHLHEPAPPPPSKPEAPAEEEEEGGEEPEAAVGPFFVAALRLLGRAAAIVAPGLALLGYFAASRYLFYPVVFSGAVIGLCVLLFHAVQDAVDRLVQPAAGGEAGAPSRIRLVPVFVGFLLICAAVPVLALVWGADVADLVSAWRTFSEGFRLGEVTISPLDFFSFLLVFAVGYVLTRILQGVLRRSVLPVTGLDEGAKAAVSAGVFYVGVIIAALIAISATGLDLSNLAIVAGALSVGIGFGLQNVVNNFVSGLILLIERPIKAGDWIELASGSGYVRQIKVRSTEIETFDRASLIVPNSELISGAVTNWTHTSLQGRVIVPIGVAYGTDPRKVERVLLEIARTHPMVLRRPAPIVLFRRFGPDALEFEIRAILRDVNWVLTVTSDINFEIARRFAEEGIQIPFPQRDLHLRNAGEVAHSIGEALRGDGAAEPPAAAVPKGRRRHASRPDDLPRDEPDGES